MGDTMARSLIHDDTPKSTPTRDHPDAVERRLRQVGAWSMLYFLLQAELGLAWDRQWHDWVGRDRFWIPPHIMLYTGIGAAGMVALAVVLIDTLRYHRKAVGADDDSTIPVFRFFHGPLGFVLLGFGTLTDLIAAPFDNYWHELYGIDVTLWSPFHIMGTLGGILIGIGIIYVFASEAAHERLMEHRVRRFLGLNAPQWGALIFLAAFMEFALPALTAFNALSLGAFSIPSYPFILALVSACLISAIQITRKPGAAMLTALLLWLLSLGTQAFIPWALRSAVGMFGFTFRYGVTPTFNYTIALMPLLFLLCALLVDSAAYWQRRHGGGPDAPLRYAWILGICTALLAVFLPPALVWSLIHFTPSLPTPQSIVLVLEPALSDLLLALPLTAIIGAASAQLGIFLGDIWYWSKC
jgi:hypothetical protein